MKTKEHASKKKSQKTTSQPLVFLCGEAPLIEEFALRCATHGYHVSIHWNTPPMNSDIQSFPSTVTITDEFTPECDIALELTNTALDVKKENLQKLSSLLPPTTLLLSSSVTVTATEQGSWIQGKHRLVGIAAFPTLLSKPIIEIAPTVYTPKETITAITNFFTSIRAVPEIVEDRVGMVLPRLLCGFINHIFFALEENLAAPDDIDQAITLGTGLPKGPIALSEELTFPQLYAVLQALQKDNSPFHYPIAPLIRQMATTGAWWHKIRKEEQV